METRLLRRPEGCGSLFASFCRTAGLPSPYPATWARAAFMARSRVRPLPGGTGKAPVHAGWQGL